MLNELKEMSMITYRANPRYRTFSPGYYQPTSNPTLLDYSLKPLKNALGFQVHEQHPAVTAFLKRNKFRASNGVVIDISAYPEIEESMKNGDFIVYLRGDDFRRDNKTDVTRFVGDLQRDGHKKAIEKALKELIQAVKNTNTTYDQYRCFCNW